MGVVDVALDIAGGGGGGSVAGTVGVLVGVGMVLAAFQRLALSIEPPSRLRANREI